MTAEQWVILIVGVIAAIFGSTGFWSWIQSRKNDESNESKMIKGIAYCKIVEKAEKAIARGYIRTEEYDELYTFLFEPYKAMGGNGTAEKLMNEVKSLPTELEVEK